MSRGGRGLMTDHGRAGGTREPGGAGGLMGLGGEEGATRGAMVEPLGRRAEAESRTQRPEVETRDPPAMMPMEMGRPEAISKTAEAMVRTGTEVVGVQNDLGGAIPSTGRSTIGERSPWSLHDRHTVQGISDRYLYQC